jgi:hypothetical protein
MFLEKMGGGLVSGVASCMLVYDELDAEAVPGHRVVKETGFEYMYPILKEQSGVRSVAYS